MNNKLHILFQTQKVKKYHDQEMVRYHRLDPQYTGIYGQDSYRVIYTRQLQEDEFEMRGIIEILNEISRNIQIIDNGWWDSSTSLLYKQHLKEYQMKRSLYKGDIVIIELPDIYIVYRAVSDGWKYEMSTNTLQGTSYEEQIQWLESKNLPQFNDSWKDNLLESTDYNKGIWAVSGTHDQFGSGILFWHKDLDDAIYNCNLLNQNEGKCYIETKEQALTPIIEDKQNTDLISLKYENYLKQIQKGEIHKKGTGLMRWFKR